MFLLLIALICMSSSSISAALASVVNDLGFRVKHAHTTAAKAATLSDTERAAKVRDKSFDKDFEQHNIRGWEVNIEKSLKSDLDRIIAKMEEGFDNFIDKVPENLLPELRKTKFWVSQEEDYPFRENEFGTMVFHPNMNWLVQNKFDTRMHRGVHIINPIEILYTHDILSWGPYVFLHELAHAYELRHRRRLNVKHHYDVAMKKGLYVNVPTREDKDKLGPAYASLNSDEFFAELTEAYFGVNDYFPKTREELKKYDPESYRFIEAAWKVR